MPYQQQPKSKRSCVNATQIRDERTGLFLRRRDDADVYLSVSLPALYRQGIAESKIRFPPRNVRLRRALAA